MSIIDGRLKQIAELEEEIVEKIETIKEKKTEIEEKKPNIIINSVEYQPYT